VRGSGVRWLVALAALGAAGCEDGPTPEEEARRMAEIQRQGDELAQAADDLEDRMLADQANLLLWQEMARRHRNVSAVATRTQLEHFRSMVTLLEQQQEKARKLKRRQLAEVELPDYEPGSAPARSGRQILSRASAPGASRARN